MNTKRVPMNSALNSGRGECSFQALSERLFERSLRFAEIVELSEKCGFGNIENEAKKAFSPPLTFVVPSVQLVASVSRIVE